jgi:hypothetical protein
MEEILQDQHLKIVIKYKNLKFSSVNDIFEKSTKKHYQTEREIFLEEEAKKEAQAFMMKLPVRVQPRDIIEGYMKKVFVRPKMFHEDLLRNEFVPSDED